MSFDLTRHATPFRTKRAHNSLRHILKVKIGYRWSDLILEPLHPRQIRALRKTPRIETFYFFLSMNDFYLDLATKGGRRLETKELARVANGAARKLQ